MKPLIHFRKKKDNKLILIEEIAYMLYKSKNGKHITDFFYFEIFLAIRSKIDTQLCFLVFTQLIDENYIQVDESTTGDPIYKITQKGWDHLSFKTYIIIKEHIHGIKVSPWMKFKRLTGIESYEYN